MTTDPIVPQKTCTNPECGKTYPATPAYWHRDKHTRDGLVYQCKECAKEASRRYYTENRERESERKRRYYTENPERHREMNRRWREKNPDKAREMGRRWREKNPDKQRASSRHYKVANPEKVRAARQRYCIENSEKIREKQRQYHAANPEKRRIHAQRRRARKLAAKGSFNATDVQLQYTSQRGKCWHCGKKVGNDYHLDHLIPLDRGGTNDARNIVISCAFCNLSKGAKMPHEWNGRLF